MKRIKKVLSATAAAAMTAVLMLSSGPLTGRLSAAAAGDTAFTAIDITPSKDNANFVESSSEPNEGNPSNKEFGGKLGYRFSTADEGKSGWLVYKVEPSNAFIINGIVWNWDQMYEELKFQVSSDGKAWEDVQATAAVSPTPLADTWSGTKYFASTEKDFTYIKVIFVGEKAQLPTLNRIATAKMANALDWNTPIDRDSYYSLSANSQISDISVDGVPGLRYKNQQTSTRAVNYDVPKTNILKITGAVGDFNTTSLSFSVSNDGNTWTKVSIDGLKLRSDCSHPAFQGVDYLLVSETPFTHVKVTFRKKVDWVPTLSTMYSNGVWESYKVSAEVATPTTTGWPSGEKKPTKDEVGTATLVGSDGDVPIGGNVTVKAEVLRDDFVFAGWYTKANEFFSKEPTCTFKAEKNLHLQAKFIWKGVKYATTVKAEPERAADVTISAEEAGYGETVTVTAAPTSDKYIFQGWYIGADKVSNELSYTHTVEKKTTLTARFDIQYSHEIKGVEVAEKAWRMSTAGVPIAGDGLVQDLLLFQTENDPEVLQSASMVYRMDGYFTDVAFGALVADNKWGGSITFDYSTNGKIWLPIKVKDTRLEEHQPNWGPSAFRSYTYTFGEEEEVRYIRINYNTTQEFKMLPAIKDFRYNYVQKEFDETILTDDAIFSATDKTMAYEKLENMEELSVAPVNWDWIGTKAGLVLSYDNEKPEEENADGTVIFQVDYLQDFMVRFVYDTSDGHEGGNLAAKIYGCATNSEDPADWTEISCKATDTKTAVMWYNRYYMPESGQKLDGYKFLKVVLNKQVHQWCYLTDFEFTYAVPDVEPLPALTAPTEYQDSLLDEMENGDHMQEKFQVNHASHNYALNLSDKVLQKAEQFAEGYMIYKVDRDIAQVDVRGYKFQNETDYPDGLAMRIMVSADGENWTELEDFDVRTVDVYRGPTMYSQLAGQIPAGMTWLKVEFPDLENVRDLVVSDVQILYANGKTPAGDPSTPGQPDPDNPTKPSEPPVNNVDTGVAAPTSALLLAAAAAALVWVARRHRRTA